MIINGLEIQQHKLSYDKIIKNTLEQSNEMTIRFINGLLGDDISLDAQVEWLDKESVSDKHTAIVADFYPRIDGKMYSIEIEESDRGDMALRVFRYTVGGAMLHSMTATDAEVNITFPQPCVVFLRSTGNTPAKLTWNVEFFDGQKVALQVPAIRLAELSVREIAERDLLPIGQFYLRTFEVLTESNEASFRDAAASLMEELKNAVEAGAVPYHTGVQMQETIRKTAENIIIKSEQEGGFTMTTNITETLPWVDYREVFTKLEERGRAEGKAEGEAKGRAEGKAEGEAKGRAEGKAEGEAKGKAETQMEIAVKAFARLGRGKDPEAIAKMLQDLEIPAPVIEAARAEADRAAKERKSKAPER